MPRNHNAGPSTLRNRNRVTNKTRLKVIKESIDADSIILDEDEEKARVISTAGVDAEDANEHHLQAVLSAAATRHQGNVRTTRAAFEKEAAPTPAAYIPTPDSTGIVDNYDELYPPGRWKDPATYVKSSDTVEESISFALVGGFVYYMDERDKEWLDKNNEEARGEGTSAQGAVSGTSTRSGRSTKSKGKDPEVNQPVAMSEDQFELVMAIFEKVTHEKTEFLHHGLDQGTPFPPFSEYQDAFSSDLEPTLFAVYAVPDWVPPASQLMRIARTVYPYWRERRLERGGHPIIPGVNLDETDTKNESYICFRRREIKAVRKTRAQQATYSDKMLRLQAELSTAMELADSVLRRENAKKETLLCGQNVWDKRFSLVDIKRKFPGLGAKEDDELFHDKERVSKKSKSSRIPIKVPPRDNGEYGSPVTYSEPMMRPKERLAMIQVQIDQEMAKRKEKDHHWEDAIDNPYQPRPVPYPSRLYKVIAASRSSTSAVSIVDTERPPREPRAARLRWGRGGRLHLDRRSFATKRLTSELAADVEDAETREKVRKLVELWRFDDDDGPAVGPGGPEEQDRKLVDDCSEPYLPHFMTLLSDQDHQTLMTDASITVFTADGRPQSYLPFRLGPPAMMRREHPGAQRLAPSISTGTPGPQTPRHPNGLQHNTQPSNGGAAVAMSAQVKNMPPPAARTPMRISSAGFAGLPGTPNGQAVSHTMPSQTSQQPPRDVTMSGVLDGAMVNGDQDVKMGVHASPSGTNGQPASAQTQERSQAAPLASPLPPKAQHQQHPVSVPAAPNGYHLASVNGYPAHLTNGSPYVHPGMRSSALSPQQMQTIKSAFAAMPTAQDGSMQANGGHLPIRPPNTYMGHAMSTGVNYQAQLAAARSQMQWASVVAQRPSPVSMVEANGADGRAQPSNGARPASLGRGMPSPALGHAVGAGQGRASPANAHIARLTPQSPSPHVLSPSLAAPQPQSSPGKQAQPHQPPMPSPSLQSRQIVGSSGAGY